MNPKNFVHLLPNGNLVSTEYSFVEQEDLDSSLSGALMKNCPIIFILKFDYDYSVFLYEWPAKFTAFAKARKFMQRLAADLECVGYSIVWERNL